GRDVENAAVEPIDDLPADIERTAREPGAAATGLAHIDRIVTGAEPVGAALADDQFGDGLTDAVVKLDIRRLAVGRIVEIETREQFRALGLRLEQGQIGEAEQQLAQLALRGGVIALLDDGPAAIDRREIDLRGPVQ